MAAPLQDHFDKPVLLERGWAEVAPLSPGELAVILKALDFHGYPPHLERELFHIKAKLRSICCEAIGQTPTVR